MTNQLDDVTGSVGDLTAKMWDELATDGLDLVVVEWVDGSPMVRGTGACLADMDVFTCSWPGIGCSEFQSLGETGELLAVL